MSHGDILSGNISNAKDVNTSQYKSSTGDHGDCDTSIDPCSGEEMADCDSPGWKSVCAHYGPGVHECMCKIGWVGDGTICADTDECGSSPCEHGACTESSCDGGAVEPQSAKLHPLHPSTL
jgi:hypothetical protein